MPNQKRLDQVQDTGARKEVIWASQTLFGLVKHPLGAREQLFKRHFSLLQEDQFHED